MSYTFATYNLVADFFDSRTDDPKLHWTNRFPYIVETLMIDQMDGFVVQELSANMAHQLGSCFDQKGYHSRFLSMTPSEVPTGAIVDHIQVKQWIGFNTGTALIGIFWKKDWEMAGQGRCWLNQNPDDIPFITDRGQTDKGFGNFNTYRCLFWIKIKKDDQHLILGNTHFPLSGNNKTRYQCSQFVVDHFKKLSQKEGCPVIMGGDFNLLPLPSDEEKMWLSKITQTFSTFDVSCQSPNLQKGLQHATWIGFPYDKFKNKVDQSGQFVQTDNLDLILLFNESSSKMESLGYYIIPGSYDPTDQSGKLLENQKDMIGVKYTASDHCMLVANFGFE